MNVSTYHDVMMRFAKQNPFTDDEEGG